MQVNLGPLNLISFIVLHHFWQLYDLDGTKYAEEDALALVIEALNEFKLENPSFIGGKYIYAPIKMATNETIATYFETIRRLHKKFPNFLVGFDLVGQEDPSPPLVSFAEQILQLPDDIKLYFHAGETNWYGSIDENLVGLLCAFRKEIESHRSLHYQYAIHIFILTFDLYILIYSTNRLMQFYSAPVESVMAMRSPSIQKLSILLKSTISPSK